ncbi:DNA ligase D [Plastorhodobacter daqingensis]|uniref:DNA ligase (ATP) n=1 Tax=Plastorhodobacter daqingensis TaxID=1387281 RepID=A0ABW2UHH9_9RHOB
MGDLGQYRSKRDLDRTPEPSGGRPTATGRAFVVQKHAARRLHFDFRLEHAGVLLSWAVTRGPSPDPGEKRLAVRTEDHPMGYRNFEGVVPEGYGKGTVMLWDHGEWEPLHDPAEGLAQGKLHFRLHGARMSGGWTLVRMRGRRAGDAGRENWLLIKERDDVAADDPDALTAAHDTSVTTGRSMAEITADAPARHRAGPPPKAPRAARSRRDVPPKGQALARPGFRAPMLARLVDAAPEGDDWLIEPKHDGYRCQIAIGKGGVRCFSRSGQDWTDRFTGIAEAAATLPCRAALLDAEVVAADEESFSALQQALTEGAPLAAYVFDLLSLDGKDLAQQPLRQRRAALEALFEDQPRKAALRLSPALEGSGAKVHAAMCRAGGEGIIAKRLSSPWRTGRGSDWLKVKCAREAEFVVGGISASSKAGRPFASLLLGVYEGGQLRYRGRVGSGFAEADYARISRHARQRDTPPFAEVPPEARRGAVWLQPDLVAQIRFAELTAEGAVRHAVFLGLREDKPAREVADETAAPGDSAMSKDEKVAGIRITSPDRLVFPAERITKRMLAEYYADAGPALLVHARDRPLSLIRCPDGIAGECFFQKHGRGSIPDAVPRFTRDGEEWLYLNGVEAMVAAVQMGTIEFHLQGVRRDRPDRPDRLVFDLDPDEGLPFARVREGAVRLRDLLAGLGLDSAPMVTGGKGVHVILRLRRIAPLAAVSAFARTVATLVADRAPEGFTANMSKARRKGRIFIDWQRNGSGATAVAPWSVRARPGAPVAVPVAWDELARLERADGFSLTEARARLDAPDPVAALSAGSLNAAVLDGLEREVHGG